MSARNSLIVGRSHGFTIQTSQYSSAPTVASYLSVLDFNLHLSELTSNQSNNNLNLNSNSNSNSNATSATGTNTNSSTTVTALASPNSSSSSSSSSSSLLPSSSSFTPSPSGSFSSASSGPLIPLWHKKYCVHLAAEACLLIYSSRHSSQTNSPANFELKIDLSPLARVKLMMISPDTYNRPHVFGLTVTSNAASAGPAAFSNLSSTTNTTTSSTSSPSLLSSSSSTSSSVRRLYCFQAASDDQCQSWLASLETHILRNSIRPIQIDSKSLKEGFLTKQGEIVRNWKSRWFVLNPATQTLKYYRLQTDSKPAGEIVLHSTSVCMAESMAAYGKEHCFSIQNIYSINIGSGNDGDRGEKGGGGSGEKGEKGSAARGEASGSSGEEDVGIGAGGTVLGRKYVLTCEDDADRDEWMALIQQVVSSCLRR